MTTTAYDTHFIASDVAFTSSNDEVHLDIPFRKVKRIGSSVIGMAGCLNCMVDFADMLVSYLMGRGDFCIPKAIIEREGSEFIAMIYLNGSCYKINHIFGAPYFIENITQVPTVIGSGSTYVQAVIDDCPNAVVAVLEAIKKDKYTDGDVKYCSIRREDVHNLELHVMSENLNMQVTGLGAEVDATKRFLNEPQRQGKTFRASTEVYYAGSPDRLCTDSAMQFLGSGFSEMKKKLQPQNDC